MVLRRTAKRNAPKGMRRGNGGRRRRRRRRRL
jgi:hypothetical protein